MQEVARYIDQKFTAVENSIRQSFKSGSSPDRNFQSKVEPMTIGPAKKNSEVLNFQDLTKPISNPSSKKPQRPNIESVPNLDDTIFHSVDCDCDQGQENLDQKPRKAVQEPEIMPKMVQSETAVAPNEPKKHQFHYIDYEYLRPSKKYLVQKTQQQEWTHFDGEPVFRNLYYGTQIPEEQAAKIDGYNRYIKEELLSKQIKPHVPEFWSYHDSWRFADAASYKKEDMVRDIVNHSPWVEEMKSFDLPEAAADVLRKGIVYVYGRDKHGNVNIYVDFLKSDTSEKGIENIKSALIFLTAVVKKYMLLPYYAELFNILLDLGNGSIWSLNTNLISAIGGIHQLHFKNSMFKLIMYNPSWTFYALWKVVSAVYNKKYLERVRIIKGGNESEFWEIFDPRLTPKRLTGTGPDPDETKSYWPPMQLERDTITLDDIKKRQLMTFDFLGHHADTTFFKKYQPWEEVRTVEEMQWDKIGKGKLDKVYY